MKDVVGEHASRVDEYDTDEILMMQVWPGRRDCEQKWACLYVERLPRRACCGRERCEVLRLT